MLRVKSRLGWVLVLLALFALAGCSASPKMGVNPAETDGGEAGGGDADERGELLVLIEAAREDYKAGRYAAARQKLERVLEDVEQDVGLQTRAGNAAYREGRYAIAADHYEKALRYADNPLPEVRYNLAMVRLTQAAAELDRVRAISDSEKLKTDITDLLDLLERYAGRPVPDAAAAGHQGASDE